MGVDYVRNRQNIDVDGLITRMQMHSEKFKFVLCEDDLVEVEVDFGEPFRSRLLSRKAS